MEELAQQMLRPELLAACTQTDASQLIWAYAVLGCVVRPGHPRREGAGGGVAR